MVRRSTGPAAKSTSAPRSCSPRVLGHFHWHVRSPLGWIVHVEVSLTPSRRALPWSSREPQQRAADFCCNGCSLRIAEGSPATWRIAAVSGRPFLSVCCRVVRVSGKTEPGARVRAAQFSTIEQLNRGHSYALTITCPEDKLKMTTVFRNASGTSRAEASTTRPDPTEPNADKYGSVQDTNKAKGTAHAAPRICLNP
jgi:hypothetical protein